MPSPSRSAKMKKLNLFNELLSIVNKEHKKQTFRRNIIAYRTRDMKRKFLAFDEHKIVYDCPPEIIREEIYYWCNYVNKSQDFKVDVSLAEYAWKYLRDNMTCLDEQPPTFRMHDDLDYCYHRLAFAPDPNMPTPTVDSTYARFAYNRDATKNFMGSLFHRDSRDQQYLFIQGAGNDGKGSMMRLLDYIFGRAYAELEIPERGRGMFFAAELIGKRIGIFNDVDNPEFFREGRFKRLTGGDAIRVEPKGEPSFKARLECKYIATSNKHLNIDDIISEKRRAIFAYINAPDLMMPDYEKRLLEEAPGFVGKSLQKYQREVVAPSLLRIPVDDASFHEITQAHTNNLRGIFDLCFELRDPETDDQKPNYQRPHVLLSEAFMVLNHCAKIKTLAEQREIIGRLLELYPIEKKEIYIPKKGTLTALMNVTLVNNGDLLNRHIHNNVTSLTNRLPTSKGAWV